MTELPTAAAPPLQWFCIDAAAIDDFDFTGPATLRELHEALRRAGVKLVFAHVSADVQARSKKYEITGLLDKDDVFDSLRTVVHAYTRTRNRNDEKI